MINHCIRRIRSPQGDDDCPYPLEDEEMPSSVREMLAARPNVGEHSEEVLREAGYSDAEIRSLRAAGLVA